MADRYNKYASYEQPEVEWNAALLYANEVIKVLFDGEEYANQGNLFRWHQHLMSIFRLINAKLKPEEKDEFNKRNNLIIPMVMKCNNPHGRNNSPQLNGTLTYKLHELETVVVGFLDRLGIIMPFKADTEGL